MTLTLTCGGAQIASGRLSVPRDGAWFGDFELVTDEDGKPLPSGAIELLICNTTLQGTVDPAHTGDFGGVRKVRVVAGGGGWGRELPALGYANDAGIRVSQVAADVAAAAGERLGATLGGDFGAHYTRSAGPASRTIVECAQGQSWWVDYAGVTQIGKRFTAASRATVLDYDPQSLRVTAVIDELTDIAIGSTLTDSQGRWKGPLIVASLEVVISGNTLRVYAWCGTGTDALTENLRKLVGLLGSQKLLGKYRYRVIRMNGDRVDLQVVNATAELPDLLTVDMWPGVSGAHATLTNGSHVAVSFLDGNRNDPIVDSFIGRAGPDPVLVELGGKGGQGVARLADTVTVPLPPMVATGTMTIGGSPTPFSAVMVSPVGQALGSITTASEKVKSK